MTGNERKGIGMESKGARTRKEGIGKGQEIVRPRGLHMYHTYSSTDQQQLTCYKCCEELTPYGTLRPICKLLAQLWQSLELIIH